MCTAWNKAPGYRVTTDSRPIAWYADRVLFTFRLFTPYDALRARRQ